ncbi:MAG: CotH kinase family protein [candidate division KSB1 bacterium]|nr:CotH kinase family protein [candidate division KSB1 bacterium]MDZ7303593.1 CotH kinase family protein [candidate division KSB1 bacterium]MDZ7312836.1 CotH kinase family protein [candidate division KSB1 bacterium]
MKLKDYRKEPLPLVFASKIWHNGKYRLSSALLCAFAIFALGAYLHRNGFIGETVTPLIKQNVHLIPRVIGGLLSTPEHITIDVKHKNFQKLAYQRERALARGILMKGADDFVPAMIRYKDKAIKVDLRLKGDWTDHLAGEKWSFRIKVNGDNTIFGMKQFSIQHPKTRNYITEWIFHRALKREDLIGLRYEFIDVTLNGKDLGIYALEEHFEKRLIEHNQLREGPIVKFNETLYWEEKLQQRLPFPDALANGSGFYISSDIDGFQTKKWLSDSAAYLQYCNAIHLLESFRRGILKTSEVFDTEKLAKFFALVDLLGAQHAAIWHNFRFYYNPVTSRLEPIGFDADCGYPTISLCAADEGVYIGREANNIHGHLNAMFFNDAIFFQEYIKALERISEPSYLDAFFAGLNGEMKRNLNILHSEFPYYDFSKEVFYQNQQYIQTVLNPVKGLHAYYKKAFADRIELQLGNIQLLPIEVLYVSFKDSLLFFPTEKNILPAKLHSELVDFRPFSFALPRGFSWSDTMISHLKINYKILGASQTKSETVFPYSAFDDRFITTDFLRQLPNVDKFKFLLRDETAKTIVIKRGTWELEQNLIIPGGYRVICREGVQLNLSNAAKILSYSPFDFIGTEDDPIIIHSADSTGQGILVLNARQNSVLEHVIFDNLSNPSQNGWKLTGAVNFYESPVDILHCQFIYNRSEDGLNIIRSEFTIDNTVFRQTQADAFDADFGKGKITNSSFINCGNDAIDVSGSTLEVQNVLIDGFGDKGLSIGEISRMTAQQIEIKNGEIAVASKDMSEMNISNVDITACKIGFAVFQKKSEYGPGVIMADKVSLKKFSVPYLVEEHSTLLVDKVAVESNQEKVKGILYGVEYGKASR